MSLDLTFKQVGNFIKQDDPKLIGAVDKLLSLTFILSPVLLGPAASVIPLLGAKNELFKLGKGVFEAITKKKDNDFLARQKRMQIAYVLICYTAFFDALDHQLPDEFHKRIDLLKEDKLFIATEAVKKAQRPRHRTAVEDSENPEMDRFANIPIPFPRPTETLSQQKKRLGELYKEMADGFKELVQKLALWDEADEKAQRQIMKAIEEIPGVAAEYFEAQYFELSVIHEDFAIWANLQEHKKTRQLLESLSDYFKQYVLLTKSETSAIDIGFKKLHKAVLTIPQTLKIAQSEEIVEGLQKHYQARINEPIIEDKDSYEDGQPRLSFPRVCDAFIPQSFRVIRQTGKVRRLEDEETWKDAPRRSDLGAFLLSYLSSPYSTETPLVILGHPGSSKSLLTKIVSAQLMSKQYTVIRVPLREVNSDAGIVNQIEEHISNITNIRLDSWAKLSASFKNNPPLVILDGYDELLQASGKVFSGYLKDVRTFQQNEAEQGRPIRVIVTSRITLIDKATIPQGSTIIRLLEFDKRQRERWVSIWNKENVNYYQQSKIKPFRLPDERDAAATKVLSLAEQPLLLLMLAIGFGA